MIADKELVAAAKVYERHKRADSAAMGHDGRYVNTCNSGCVVVHTEAAPGECNQVWAQAETAAMNRAFQLHALSEAFKVLGAG